MFYNYVFWYNEYEEIWYAIHRNTQIDFFSGNRKKAIYESDKSIENLFKKIK